MEFPDEYTCVVEKRYKVEYPLDENKSFWLGQSRGYLEVKIPKHLSESDDYTVSLYATEMVAKGRLIERILCVGIDPDFLDEKYEDDHVRVWLVVLDDYDFHRTWLCVPPWLRKNFCNQYYIDEWTYDHRKLQSLINKLERDSLKPKLTQLKKLAFAVAHLKTEENNQLKVFANLLLARTMTEMASLKIWWPAEAKMPRERPWQGVDLGDGVCGYRFLSEFET